MTTKRHPRLLTLHKRTAEQASASDPGTAPKWLFASYSALMNIVLLGLSFVPAAAHWEAAHTKETAAVFVVLNLLVRLISHGRVYLYGSDD